jgi:pSer/pThr/pTyr-binding forkhead associated (FHA) protein
LPRPAPLPILAGRLIPTNFHITFSCRSNGFSGTSAAGATAVRPARDRTRPAEPDPPMSSPGPDRTRGSPQAPLWVAGGFAVRLGGRILRIDRPYAVVGRAPGADLRVAADGASLRHAYLHLDPRGRLFAVDLASRTGLRVDGEPRRDGWVGPGQSLEVAGTTIEVLGVDGDGAPGAGAEGGSLIEDDGGGLVPATLTPDRPAAVPRALASALVFLGRGACCGLRVDDPSAARVHLAVVRTASAAFAVDLVGAGVRRNGRPAPGASRLDDGDLLAVGREALRVRVGHPAARRALTPAPFAFDEVDGVRIPAAAVELLPAAPAGDEALIAWGLRAVRDGQGELLRRQGDFQEALARAVRDQSALLRESLQRMEHISRELADLRAELARATAPAPAALPSGPLRLPRLEPAEAPSGRSTSWLLDRVQRLEDENRASWRDLIGRLAPAPRRAD